MKIANKIFDDDIQHIVSLLVLVVWSNCVWAAPQQEKLLYATNFDDWTSQAGQVPAITVTTQTVDLQDLTFTTNNTEINPTGTNTKFDYTQGIVTEGYLMGQKENGTDDAAKQNYAYVETSTLSSITRILFVQAATGSKRGWGLMAKGDGDTDWVVLDDTPIGNSQGEVREVQVDRTNVQLRFYSIKPGENAFMTSLNIWGNVEVKENVQITYYDSDGVTVLGQETVPTSKPLEFMSDIGGQVTVPEGSMFRGWFNGMGVNAEKVREGNALSHDLKLYAVVTPIETVLNASKYEYDLRKRNFYPEDHDLIDITGGSWYNGIDGWQFPKGGTITLQVAGNASVNMSLCPISKVGTITVVDAMGREVSSFGARPSVEGAVQTFEHRSEFPTTLTISMPAESYLHGITLSNYIPVYVRFDLSDKNIEGVAPDDILCDPITGKATMPNHSLLCRNGWTFVGWTDDDANIYQPGEEITFLESTTLRPKMKINTTHLTDTFSDIQLTWPFDHREAPKLMLNDKSSPSKLPYTKVITIDDFLQTKQDIPLWIDASKGKFDNTDSRINALSGGAPGAQVNNETTFSLPAVYDMQIRITASDKVDNTAYDNETFFGKDPLKDAIIEIYDSNGYKLNSQTDSGSEDITISGDHKTIQFVYKGDAEKVYIRIVKAGSNSSYGFFKEFTVQYPNLPCLEYWVFISNSDLKNFPNEAPINAGMVSVELQDTNSPHNNTGIRYKNGDVVTIKVASRREYTFHNLTITRRLNMNAEELEEYIETTDTTYTYTVQPGIINITASFLRKDMKKIVVSSSDYSQGTVTLSPRKGNFYNEVTDENGKLQYIESWFLEGDEVTLRAEAAKNYMLDKWTEGDVTLTQNNLYIYKVGSTDRNITADFKLGNIGTVIFKIPDGIVNEAGDDYNGSYSITPEPMYNVRSFAVPTSYAFYKNGDAEHKGYTLQYWVEENSDGQNHYDLGRYYSFKESGQQLVLVPVFKKNPATHENRQRETILHYDFGCDVQDFIDPISGEHRKVCAQEVSIGSNQKPFWTTQTYLSILESGEDKSHDRDVAMWCDTGGQGYIRNTDLGYWCAFGPGTTFWVPSASGSTISMLTYSQITTTTIDGVVPTLDEERTLQERKKWNTDKIYVYSSSIDNVSDRVAVHIGDDYSYYQWIEVRLSPVNLVNLRVSLDDESHAKIYVPVSLSGNGVTELEDGSYDFHKGDHVRLPFNRKFGHQLDKIIALEEDGEYEKLAATLLKMNDDGTVDMALYGDASHMVNVPRNPDGSWGEHRNTMFVLREVNGDLSGTNLADSLRTRYELEFDITNHRSIQIQFKEKPTYYVTYTTGQQARGTAPEANWVEDGDPFVIPRNQTLYYEGNTLDHWVELNDYNEVVTDDDGNPIRYEIGTTYHAQASDLRLSPVFRVNEGSILDVFQPTTATWVLNKQDGAPNINYEGSSGILVTQLELYDTSIDLLATFDATHGKFSNTNVSAPQRMQINEGSVVEFPSTSGCKVKWIATEPITELMIGGQVVKPTGGVNTEVEAECSGNIAVDKIEFIHRIYSSKFTVTYMPQASTWANLDEISCGDETYGYNEIVEQMERDGHITFHVSPWLYDEQIPPMTGTASGGTVEFSTPTLFDRSCVATLRLPSGIVVNTYPIEFVFNTPEPTSTPRYVKMTLNGIDYTQPKNEVYDAPSSGLVKVEFDRTMQGLTINPTEYPITSTSKPGRTLEFKYWDIPRGGTVHLQFPPELGIFTDIYGAACQDPLELTLHIINDEEYYHHHRFDFVVGVDGTIDEAIAAANNNDKVDNHRYYIFVPDGNHELTGNTLLSCPTSGDGVPVGEDGQPRPDMNGKNNAMTNIVKPNISIIGQSKEGTLIWNHPVVEGIRYNATISVTRQAQDFYAQDLTLENTFDYLSCMAGQKKSASARAVAFYDCGKRTIMKNVALKSWQDTYYSNNPDGDFRGYFETSDLYGASDWICGNGDIWFEKCNLLHRDRSSNNIVASATEETQEFGYVFNECSIKVADEHPTLFADRDWTLGRPWNKSPGCTFVNTYMFTQPRNSGWTRMSTVPLPLRFHEYHSMDGNGNRISLSMRSIAACMPESGSDECLLSNKEAQNYTIRNVVGGPDAFDPNVLCRQIDAKSAADADRDENSMEWDDKLELDDDVLTWNNYLPVLCYMVFKLDEKTGKWIYQENTTESGVNLTTYGSGYYCVRAANQRGGLGAATKAVHFTITDPYELEIKPLNEGDENGWNTICLPFNSKVPEGVTVYAATAHDKLSDTDKVTDLILTLTPVDVINAEKGYVVYGPVGNHLFHATSRSSSTPTILGGNPTWNAISATNVNCYVLANKAWGLGFYRFVGATLKPYRAWLPMDMVSNSNQNAIAAGTKGIRMVIGNATAVSPCPLVDAESDDAVYTLSGTKVEGDVPRGVYISRSKGKFIKKY